MPLRARSKRSMTSSCGVGRCSPQCSFPLHLINLKPGIIGLFHILPCDGDIGRRNYRSGGLLRKETVFSYCFLALYPASDAHSVLLNQKRGNKVVAFAFMQPFPGFLKYLFSTGDAAVLLLGFEIFLNGWYFRAFLSDIRLHHRSQYG